MLRFLGLRRGRSSRFTSQTSTKANFPRKLASELIIEETESTEVSKQKKADDILTTQITPRAVTRIVIETQSNPSTRINESAVYILEDTNSAKRDIIPVNTLSEAKEKPLKLQRSKSEQSNCNLKVSSPVDNPSENNISSTELGGFSHIAINKYQNFTHTTTHNSFTPVSTDSPTTTTSLLNGGIQILKNVVYKDKEMAGISPTGLSPEAVPALDVEIGNANSVDEITPILPAAVSSGYGAVEPAPNGQTNDGDGISDGNKKEKKKGKEDKKGGKDDKKATKAVSDVLKTDMAAERTFFKWLWTGLHTGAIGSFIFVTFDTDKNDPKRLLVVGFSWLVAFCLVLYGTFVYYRRRRALRNGEIEEIPEFTREHSPLVVVFSLLLVIGVSSIYALNGEKSNQSIPTDTGPNGNQGGLQPVSAGSLGTG